MTAVAAPDLAAVEPRPGYDAPQRLTIAGLVVVITVIALEGMAVATVMPTVAQSLHAVHLFGWAFNAYFLATVVGMVDAGSRTDRHGPTPSLVAGLLLFAAGLVAAAAAPDIAVFLASRALQGLGGGQIIVAVYVIVARAFAEASRPRVFAAMSAAWVVPALVGPVLAGAVTSAWGWRWVFLGVAPMAAAGTLLLVPVLRRLPSLGQPSARPRRLGPWGAVALAIGLALVQLAGEHAAWWSLPILAAGAGAAGWPLSRLLPAGALRLRRGLPTVIVLRGVLTAGFFGAEAYLPLTLTRLHHGTPTQVGLPLTIGALGWSLGSWWQGRQAGRRAPMTVMASGFAAVAIGVASLAVVTVGGTSMWLAAPVWAIAGLGMGLAMPTISVQMLGLSPQDEQGANSAALQVSDIVGSVLGVAAAATVVAAAGTAHFAAAIRVVDPLLALVAVGGVALSARAR